MIMKSWMIAAIVSAALGNPAFSADWPTKPITLVTPFGAPGVADVLARVIADPLAAELKQPVVIENRVGAAGAIASAQVAHAQPDGYTLLLSGFASQVIAPATMANPSYDSMADFTHIAYLGGPPVGWVAGTSTSLKTVEDVVRGARSGEIAVYATPGIGTAAHLATEFILQKTGTKLTNIPYNTAAMTDIIGGRVPFGSFAWSSVVGQIKGNAVRPIAITSAERVPDFPDVPTFRELGYDLVATTWFAVSGPKGMPPEIVQRLNEALVRIMKLPDVRARLAPQSIETRAMTPDELTRFFAAEIAQWRPIAIAAGLKQE
jgi:tripartite-type tricarboxylate transporter receptor subunit TctC